MRTAHTITFQKIKNTATSHGFCSACGKATTRQRTFEATVNPFNRNPDGTVKTPAEVRAYVLQQCRDWTPRHDHINCPGVRAERVARRLAGK